MDEGLMFDALSNYQALLVWGLSALAAIALGIFGLWWRLQRSGLVTKADLRATIAEHERHEKAVVHAEIGANGKAIAELSARVGAMELHQANLVTHQQLQHFNDKLDARLGEQATLLASVVARVDSTGSQVSQLLSHLLGRRATDRPVTYHDSE